MTLASALVNGYEPHIINWNGLRPVAPKFVGLYQYLEGMQDMIHPEDLLMLVDGHDTIFQLPQDHVIKQYFAINKNRKFGEDFIVTGADKGTTFHLKFLCLPPTEEASICSACHPNYWNEKHVCDAAPVSLPDLPAFEIISGL